MGGRRHTLPLCALFMRYRAGSRPLDRPRTFWIAIMSAEKMPKVEGKLLGLRLPGCVRGLTRFV